MEQLLFSEINLVSGGDCLEECMGDARFKRMLDLGVEIAVIGLSILAIFRMAAACCGWYNREDGLSESGSW